MAILKPPDNGVTVRMYRQGHGDCFLLALPRKGGGDPVYILIDCGYKPGSQAFVHKKSIGDVVKHIGKSTNNKIDLMVITHEHQDHVNGIYKKKDPYFKDLDIKRAWFAWTEDPVDPDANELRRRHKDQLLGLVEARRQLALAVGDDNPSVGRLDSLLNLEFGGEGDTFNLGVMRAAAKDPSKSINKQGMKLIKDKVVKATGQDGILYLSPGGELEPVPGADGIRAYVLGPPKSPDLLKDEDPAGSEAFPGHGVSSRGLSFSSALGSDDEARAPFADHYCIPENRALKRVFFRDHYGREGEGDDDSKNIEVPGNASWRRIGEEWLFSAESMALKMNSGVNNTSLVLAFELPNTKKILLFVGDAQKGNWVSWDDQTWQDGNRKVTAKDILKRTVLYKVGHHGSHNATLAGKEDSDYPNLSWMGRDRFSNEFTAMITAVHEWAITKNNPPWRHPLKSIREALEQKTEGRIFQTDISKPEKPDGVSDTAWKAFLDRSKFEELYFDYEVLDA